MSARPSVIGSPRPTIPALVWIFRNSQRGLTRNVSSLVMLKLLFGGDRGVVALLLCERISRRESA